MKYALLVLSLLLVLFFAVGLYYWKHSCIRSHQEARYKPPLSIGKFRAVEEKYFVNVTICDERL